MAISRESFLKRIPKDRSQHPVISFLRKNHRNAFTVKEIVKATGMKAPTIRSFLFEVRKKNLVHHNSPYFMVNLSPKKTRGRNVSKRRNKKKSKK